MRPTIDKKRPVEDALMIARNTEALMRLAEAHAAALASSTDAEPVPETEPRDAPAAEPAWQEPKPNIVLMFAMGVLLAFGLVIALGIIERDMPPRHTPQVGPTPESAAHEALGARIAVARVLREAERREHPGRYLKVREGWRWTAGKDGYDKVLGTVYNGSLRTVTAWRATVFYADVTGRVLGAYSTLSNAPLVPGGTHQFLLMHRHVPGAATAEAMVVQASFRN